MDCPNSGQRKPTLRSRIRWFTRARPADYLMALSELYAALPLVGRHLEPLGGLAALGVWGYRHAPKSMSVSARTALLPRVAELRRQQREQADKVARDALHGIVAPERLNEPWPEPDNVAPVVRGATLRRRYLHRGAVRYGSSPAQVLDVWRRPDLTGPAPVLVFVPGGAWVHGSRLLQGYTLLGELAERGWVCLSIDYRVSPRHRWPRHILDVKAAVAWARANVDQFGGDRDFVAIAGCSAGGHLAALTGLTHDDADFAGELTADEDTSVDAVVGLYGRYDWVDRSNPDRENFMDFLERVVVKKRQDRRPEVFLKASPIDRLHPDAPPFLVVHGDSDTVIPVEQARKFVDRLRAASTNPVGYLEFPGARHGFDLVDGVWSQVMATAVGRFLDQIHSSHVARSKKVVI